MADGKSSPKVMDVVHPGSAQPSPSGRPVIVSNRPYIKVDPMLSAEGAGSATDAKASVASSPQVPPASGAAAVSEPAAQPKPEPPVEEQPQPVAAVLPPHEKVIAVPEEDNLSVEPTPTTSTDTEESTQAALEKEPRPAPEPAPAESNIAASILQAQVTPTIDDEAAKAREDELEQLIAAGTYAVPINKTGRRKKNLLLTLLILLLFVIVAVDVLADMGVISLPLIPHTNFFGS